MTSHIIWDWNGTLVNDAPVACAVLNEMLARRALAPVSFEHYREIYCHPIQRIYERVGFDLVQEPFGELADEWHAAYLDASTHAKLHHDSLETLQRFHSAGRTQVILSALPHDILSASVALHRLENFFSEVQGLEDRLARSKADTAQRLMHRLGAERDSILMVGDSAHDAEGATLLGIRCVLVSRGYESRERLGQHGFPVCSDFSEMLQYV